MLPRAEGNQAALLLSPGSTGLPETAVQEMQMTKNSITRRQHCNYHAGQSFAPGEVTTEQAHEIGAVGKGNSWGDRLSTT